MMGIDRDNQGAAISDEVPEDSLALIDVGGNGEGRHYNYGELIRLSGGFARGLLKRGLQRGDAVAIFSANRAEFLIAFLGTLQAGLIAVPVNWKLPSDTIAFILDDCQAKLIVGDDERLRLAPQHLLRVSFDTAFAQFLDNGPFAAVKMQSDDPAMFLYTSGSTGRPKGVVLSHYSHLWCMHQRKRGPGSYGLRSLVAAPLYHMNALAVCQNAFNQGDTIILLPSFTTKGFVEAAAKYRADILTAVPTMIAMIMREKDVLASSDLSTVTAVRMGSAPLTQSLIDRVREVFPRALIANGYGTTEAGPIVFGPHPRGLPQPPLSTGYPHPAVQLRLSRDGQSVSDEGVLEMKCPAVMTRYHNLPDATAKVITADGYYRTGDVFRRDENGFFFFVGRADDMFVCGGENIYPGEVEKMLERHPDIHQAAILPIADELKGFKPIAFVVRSRGSETNENDVKQYALENAPAYQHPRRVIFVDEMPLAGTNKIDKRVLATKITPEEMS